MRREALTQSSLTGDGLPLKIRSKKAIKSGSLKFYQPSAETPEAVIDDLENIYHRDKFYAMTSGGKDSVSLCHWLAEQGKLEAAVHIKTNVGIQATTDFVKDLCKDHGWKLHVIEPIPQFSYAAHVLQYGFPLARFHPLIMGRLKSSTMRNFALTIDRKRHCLISGIRKFESKRRMGNYPHPIQTDGSMWFGCPFFYKSSEEVYRYIHANGLKITPVSKIMGMSGDCMCGAYATNEQKALIRQLDSKLADYIEWLEDGIQKFGTPHAKRYPKWGGRSKMSEIEQQQQIDSFFKENPELEYINAIESLVCGVECGPGTMKGENDY